MQAVTAYGLANLNRLLSREGLYKDQTFATACRNPLEREAG